ncbi:MAG: phenylalanine--tRNA ligase beta subunit-related protein [Bacteroidota bacterium]
MFEVTTAWKSAFPGAHAGVLVMKAVTNPAQHPELEERKAELEKQLRVQFSGQDRAALSSHPVLQAYNNHYRRFKKSYHVQLQMESVAWKGKSIPSVSALVEAMFMAEMKNLLLTAGHDLDIMQLPLTLDVSKGTESYTLMRGETQILKPGDMMISDQAGVICDVIYGPDRRTQITQDTHNVVFTTYAPQGIERQAVEDHLTDIRDYILIFAPQAHVELLKVFGTN